MFNKWELKQSKRKDKLIKYAEYPLISQYIFISAKKKKGKLWEKSEYRA